MYDFFGFDLFPYKVLVLLKQRNNKNNDFFKMAAFIQKEICKIKEDKNRRINICIEDNNRGSYDVINIFLIKINITPIKFQKYLL